MDIERIKTDTINIFGHQLAIPGLDYSALYFKGAQNLSTFFSFLPEDLFFLVFIVENLLVS